MFAAVITAEKKECGVYNLSKAWAVEAILRQPVNPPAQPRDAWTTSIVSVASISPNLETPCSDSIPATRISPISLVRCLYPAISSERIGSSIIKISFFSKNDLARSTSSTSQVQFMSTIKVLSGPIVRLTSSIRALSSSLVR